VIETGDGGGAANLVICEILLVHAREDILDEKGSIDPDKIRLVGRMGGDYYTQAFGSALFKVAKPLDRLGIGVDKLPDFIRNSHILSGNDLGKLANIEHLPHENDLAQVYLSPAWIDLQKKFGEDPGRFATETQLLAKELLSQGQTWEALCLLLA
jgi:hypothetical protein